MKFGILFLVRATRQKFFVRLVNYRFMSMSRLVARHARAAGVAFSRVIALAVSMLALAAVCQTIEPASLHGTVRDPQGKPISNVTVRLQPKGSMQILVAHTDSQGKYAFSSLPAGSYALRAELAGYTAASSSVELSSKEVKTVDLTLAPAKSTSPTGSLEAPQFSDSPEFSVSGVTDTTSLGGHGSDTLVRTRDSLAKETALLGKDETGSTPVLAGVERSQRERAERPQKERREEAERERNRARSLLLQHPDDPKLHHLLAEADEKLGEPLAAVQEYQRAAELDPSEANLFDWGSELLLHHAAEPAADVFVKGNHLFPTSSRLLLGLGAAWFARGAVDQAVEEISDASDLNPADSAPYLFLGKIENAETVPTPKIVDTLHRFVALQPGNAEANYYYALGLWKLRKSAQDAAQVESLLSKAVDLDPEFGPAYLQLGILHSEQGNYVKAISNYQRAIAADVQRSDQQNIQKSAQTSDPATVNAEIEDAHYRLAQAYRHIGDDEKAKSELKIYRMMARESGEETDREHHEIQQFVYTLRDQPPAQNH